MFQAIKRDHHIPSSSVAINGCRTLTRRPFTQKLEDKQDDKVAVG